MSMTQLLQMHARPVRMARLRGRVLPYLLSLPALLVCVAILIPFFTAAVYSLQRYRLNLPYLRGFKNRWRASFSVSMMFSSKA